jgi:hypothetical protein
VPNHEAARLDQRRPTCDRHDEEEEQPGSPCSLPGESPRTTRLQRLTIREAERSESETASYSKADARACARCP